VAEFKIAGGQLTVTGRLDSADEDELRERLGELFDSGAETISVDLSKLEGISSLCIGSLVALWIDLREAGKRLKIRPSPAVKRMFDLSGLADVFAGAGARRRPEGQVDGPGAEGSREEEGPGEARRARFEGEDG
jgi:anti-anti-sigma factor